MINKRKYAEYDEMISAILDPSFDRTFAAHLESKHVCVGRHLLRSAFIAAWFEGRSPAPPQDGEQNEDEAQDAKEQHHGERIPHDEERGRL